MIEKIRYSGRKEYVPNSAQSSFALNSKTVYFQLKGRILWALTDLDAVNLFPFIPFKSRTNSRKC